MRQIADYLFMASLIWLIVSFMIVGVGSRVVTYHGSSEGANTATDLPMQHDHKKVLERQNKFFYRIIRSKLFWASLAGIIVSVIFAQF